MKRGTIEHPKLAALAGRLDVPRYAAAGILESLWHFTAQYARRGDIGRWSDAEIARAIDWRGEPATLIAALVDTGWFDRVAKHRLIVHDWGDHLDNGVRSWLSHHSQKPIELKKAQPRLSRGSAHAESAIGLGNGSGSGGGSGGKRSRTLPEGETLTPARLQMAQEAGLTGAEAKRQWRLFSLHEFRDPHSDWDRTWQKWCLNSLTYGRTASRPTRTDPARPAAPSSEETRTMLRDKGLLPESALPFRKLP